MAMLKITFMGAGSTVFARNVLGDCMCTHALPGCEFALYDIDARPPGGELPHHLRHEPEPTAARARSSPIWEWRTGRKPCGAPNS